MKLIKYHRSTIARWKAQAWTLLFGILCFVLGALFHQWLNTPIEYMTPLGQVNQVYASVDIEPEDVKTDAEKAIEIWFEEDDWGWAKRVSWCESKWNPLAKNKNSSASGLFQIVRGTWKGYKCEGDIFDAWDNTECASKIYERSGPSQWKCK